MNNGRSDTFKYASKGLIAIAITGVVLQLPGCGGGGTTVGAPLNPAPGPSQPAPLVVNPPNVTLYVNQPSSLFVTGGVPPYRAFSQNPALLPVLQDVIGSVVPISASGAANAAGNTTTITVSVTDAVGTSTPATVTVIPSPFLVSPDDFVISGANCTSTDSVCAGQTAVATLKLRGATGAPLAGRQVRFEALQGQFSFVLDDASSQLSKTITVTSDSQGQAIVRLKADVNAITSFALVRATELTSGARLDKSFPITQVTSGEGVLSVTPTSWSIKGPFKGFCSSGAEVGYYVFGGTPPYRVVSSLPNSITVGNLFGGPSGGTTTVSSNGGYFTGRTNGGCVLNTEQIIFVTDATGRTVGVGLENVEGSDTIPAPPPPATLVVSPAGVSVSTLGATCGNGAQAFLLQGGSGSSYRAVVTNADFDPSNSGPAGTVRIIGGAASTGIGTYQLAGGAFVVEYTGPFASGSTISEITVTDAVSTPVTVKLTCGV
jgi:hypothetical protein